MLQALRDAATGRAGTGRYNCGAGGQAGQDNHNPVLNQELKRQGSGRLIYNITTIAISK